MSEIINESVDSSKYILPNLGEYYNQNFRNNTYHDLNENNINNIPIHVNPKEKHNVQYPKIIVTINVLFLTTVLLILFSLITILVASITPAPLNLVFVLLCMAPISTCVIKIIHILLTHRDA